jgi:UDP-N-acetylglucosamine 2-epimerase (non-hydrolysing)/GDP/UDP-N,N'-diacetylbacillosamine 2-epimerase (hydrolysing)
MRKICIVTGSRAEYGLLSRLMRLIQEDAELTLQIIATNMHLSPEFGLTYKDIEKDGFRIDKKVEMLLSSDTANATTKSVGLATIGFADAYEDLKPDLLLVVGDRYEILAAVTAALFYKIPVAHLHGGEITEGAYDDAIRHAVTKMSHLHFTSTEEYRKRVIQLGEEPNRVFNVGAIGIDNIKHLQLMPKHKLEESLNFKFGEKCVLVTFHPVTLERNTAEEQIKSLLQALKSIDDLRILFTLPNSDTDGRIIMQMINQFVEENKNRSIVFNSLGQLKYLSALQFIDAVVGNSSSGLIEVPSFGIPTLNIGHRQQGRIKAKTIVDCESTFENIREKLKLVLSSKYKESCKKSTNPYEKENTAIEILSVIRQFDLDNLILKKFFKI